ncbi:MAG: glycosyltransferase family 2 protein [Verrucomicrobia bacterium]|nr:glycosyltransferase family 2 protein [Verrucomicrobiota bacterium]
MNEAKDSPLTLSVVIPVFNSEQILPELCDRLSRVLPAVAAQYEVILVNDGSSDRSWQVISKLLTKFEWLKGIDLMRNYGQHGALLCGIREAVYEITVTMDDDLEHPPEEIPKLCEKLREGYDVVYGTPGKEQHGLWRNIASRLSKLVLQSVMRREIARHVSAFRMFRTGVRDGFANYQGTFVSIDVLLTWGTARFAAIVVLHSRRRFGVSNYTLLQLLTHAANMMTGFSTLPLQLASLIGFTLTIFGFGVLLWVVGRYLIEGVSVPGFAFLASTTAIFSGAQLFALGIIGEYLARMHFRMMERPPYVVRSSFKGAGKETK